MTASTQQRIGVDVRAARKARHWTQEQLAQAANLGSANTVIALEAGRNTRAGSVRAVCDALGIDPTSHVTEYPTVIRITRDMLAAWMLTLSDDEVEKIPGELTRWIVTRNSRAPAALASPGLTIIRELADA